MEQLKCAGCSRLKTVKMHQVQAADSTESARNESSIRKLKAVREFLEKADFASPKLEQFECTAKLATRSAISSLSLSESLQETLLFPEDFEVRLVSYES